MQVKKEEKKFDYLVKLVVLGDSAVGKTNILLRFTNRNCQMTHISTIGVDFKVKTITLDKTKVKLQIWDTAGQERYRHITQIYYKGAAGIIFVYSVTDRESFEHIETWMRTIAEKHSDDIPKIIVGNKCDSSQREVSFEEGQALAERHHLPFLETSAKENVNIEEVFLTIGRKIKERLQNDEIDQMGQRGIVLPLPDPKKRPCQC